MSRAASILAVRNVARILAQPAPEFLDVIGAVKSCSLLTQELPLANASPFGALPNPAGEQPQRNTRPAEPAGRIDLPRRVAAAPPRLAEPRAETHDSKTAPAPVFSFRRAERAAETQARASSAAQLAPVDTTKIDPSESRASSLSAETARPAAAMFPTSISGSAPAISHPREMAAAAIELLDSLATELLAAPNISRAADSAPRWDETNSTRRGVPATNLSTDSEMRHGPSRETSVLTPGRSPVMTPVYESEGLGALPSSASATSSGDPVGMPHAAHLVSQSGDVANLARAHQAATPSVSFSPDSFASQNLDAETLASMVNEVLAEQARRHGVDLS